MSRIEKAYQLGYRATIDGKLNLNGKEARLYVQKKNSGRNLLYFSVPKINGMLYLSKLQAYQKFGKRAFDENCMYIDGNTLNCSYDNITLKSFYKDILKQQDKYYCSSCNKILNEDCFYKCDLAEKECPYRIAQCRECRQERVRENRKYMHSRKEAGCCVCGEKDIACLDFHHMNDKYDQVSHMQTHSRNKIVQETDKCVVLCSNCHRKLHYYNKSIEQLKQEFV